jgi:hypothetical protein
MYQAMGVSHASVTDDEVEAGEAVTRSSLSYATFLNVALVCNSPREKLYRPRTARLASRLLEPLF